MNLNEMFPSNYLSKDDFPAPRVLVIANVTREQLRSARGKEMKTFLHFEGNVKPMILNKTNGLAIAKLYGRSSDAWISQPIDVYTEPNVTMAGQRVGGIRVRIPTGPRPVAGAGPRASAANGATPNVGPKAAPPPVPQLSLADKHAQVLAGFAGARTTAKLDEWARWAHGCEFTPELDDDLSDAYHAAKERITQAEAPTGRPAPANVSDKIATNALKAALV